MSGWWLLWGAAIVFVASGPNLDRPGTRWIVQAWNLIHRGATRVLHPRRKVQP